MGQSIQSPAMDIFFGEIDEDIVFPFPGFSNEQKELASELVSAFNNFAEAQMDGERFDKEGVFPEEYLEGLKGLGLYGLSADEQYGGMELDISLSSRIFQEIAGLDAATSVFLGGHQSIGYKALINEGTEEQKDKWLPDLVSGKRLAAFCLTEPGSGSDAYSIKTKATDNGDGTFTITGQKLWITNGGSADFYTVFCKTDHKAEGKTAQKITCFVVEKDASGSKGLSFGEKENKMGIKASETRAVYFDKVTVPKENILGEPGKGFKVAMKILNSGRLSLGSGTVGGMKRILKLATEHAVGRVQFERPISEFGLIQKKLTQMASLTYASESVVYFTTGLIHKGLEEYQLESAICKIFCSESLWEVVDTGLQVAGGNGYMCEYPYERMMRDSRINLIFEGTNEILRVFLALSGIKGPAESLKEVGKIADISQFLKDPIKSLGILTDFARGRIKKMIGMEQLTRHHRDIDQEAKVFSALLGQFALQVESTLTKYGKKIIGNEYPQGRIANMATYLYVMLALISRTAHILGSDIEEKEKSYVKLLFNEAFHSLRYRLMADLKGMNKNFDKETEKLSKMICEKGQYGLDIIHF